MIKTYSQKILHPYAGQVQIAESDRARALTMDGNYWEIQFLRGMKSGEKKQSGLDVPHSYFRVAKIQHSEIKKIALPAFLEDNEIDERIVELADFISSTDLPFPAMDQYEYWLLDKDESPLALIFSCCEAPQMETFPDRPEWVALPSAAMKIDKTEEEESSGEPPVNYRLERNVNERAGQRPKAAWFNRKMSEGVQFPPLLVREDWEDENDSQLCQRYITRQAPRLLMLHGLEHADRLRLEQAARSYALEVGRFYPLYPEIADEKLMKTIRVEARLRNSTSNAHTPA